MQVDSIKPSLTAPGTERLKLSYDGPLSNFAFKFNLHRYSVVTFLFRDSLFNDRYGGADLAADALTLQVAAANQSTSQISVDNVDNVTFYPEDATVDSNGRAVQVEPMKPVLTPHVDTPSIPPTYPVNSPSITPETPLKTPQDLLNPPSIPPQYPLSTT